MFGREDDERNLASGDDTENKISNKEKSKVKVLRHKKTSMHFNNRTERKINSEYNT